MFKLSISLSLNNVCDDPESSDVDDLDQDAQLPIPTITTANEFGEVVITWSQDMKVNEEKDARKLSQEAGVKVWMEPGSIDV